MRYKKNPFPKRYYPASDFTDGPTAIQFVEQAEYISDVTDRIDYLIEQANSCKDKVVKRELLQKAQDLQDAYELYVEREVFKKLL